MSSVGVIGGGAAGMMAALMAKERHTNCRVALFEKNSYLGAKVLISGGGRCNVTTGILDVRELLKNYPRGAEFLMTALFRFPPEKVMEWFEDHSVPLKIEEDLRIFPKSDKGSDVVGALQRALHESGVEILCNAPVTHVTRHQDSFCLTLKDGREFLCDKLIITTGGNAYRHTGSTGDGYAFAQGLGHTITPLGPSLSAFVIAEPWVKTLAGVSFEKAKLTLQPEQKSKKMLQRVGPFVFTHRGISGPAVFALSSYAAYEQIEKNAPRTLTIDFFPDEPAESFHNRFLALLQKHPGKRLSNFLDMFLPKSLCRVVSESAALPENTVAGNLKKQDRDAVAYLLKQFPVTIIGRSAGEEFVTAGGVDLAEVNTNTMESKICPGLYFAGEILDVDGFTGGFNLQASWATGVLAGSSLE